MLKFFQKNKNLIFLLIIIILAAFFRLWQLDSIPAGLYPDVAINGNDALELLKTGSFKVFYPDNNGREGFFIWLLALSFSVFGISIWSIKIVAAIIGILTVFGLYLLTKELFDNLTIKQFSNLAIRQFNNKIIALLASFFLAISFWHTNFSRIGFRAILLPFILVFGFYFLLKGFRTKKIWHFIGSGIFFGLGFYTYISYRFIVFLLPIFLLCWFFIYRRQNLQKIFFINTLYLLLTIFIIILPIGFYFLQNLQDFVSRAAPVSIFATENPIKEFGKSLISHLTMFNFYGDPNWRHNFSGSPMLFWPIGILFLIGLIYSIFLCRKKFCGLTQRNFGTFPFGFLICWWLIMLLPGILTYEGVPHALRVIGVIPVIYIFVGLGGWKVYEFLNLNTKRKKLLIFTSFLFLFALTTSEFNKYFVVWAKHPKVEEAFTKTYYDIGNYLNSLPSEFQKYVIVNEPEIPLYGISIPAQTPMFIEKTKYGKSRTVYLKFEDLDQIKIDKQKTIIIPLYDGKTFDELSKKFPGGEIKTEKSFQFYELF